MITPDPLLIPLLRDLAAVGLHVTQHAHDPRPDAWYASLNSPYGGDVGPEPSAEAALVAGVRWLIQRYNDKDIEEGETFGELADLRYAAARIGRELLALAGPMGDNQR